MAQRHVGRLSEIPTDRPFLLETEGYAIGIIRVEEKIFAYENKCLHQGGPVCLGDIWGKIEPVLGEHKALIAERYTTEEKRLVCPWHGWEYHLETGACVTDPTMKLRSFAVTVRDDEVFIDL